MNPPLYIDWPNLGVAFYRVASGDDCIYIQQAHPDTFTMKELYQWNPIINKDCTNLQVGDTICIRKLMKDCPTGAWVDGMLIFGYMLEGYYGRVVLSVECLGIVRFLQRIHIILFFARDE